MRHGLYDTVSAESVNPPFSDPTLRTFGISRRSFYNLDRLDMGCNMARIWQLQEAKNKFSEVVDEALIHGPQVITRRGVETVIVLSWADYHQLMRTQQKLSEFFRESPLAEADLDLQRDTSNWRQETPL